MTQSQTMAPKTCDLFICVHVYTVKRVRSDKKVLTLRGLY